MKTVPTFFKRKHGVQHIVANKFRLLLEFRWVSSGSKNNGWLWWVVVVKLWLVMGGGCKIMPGSG